MQLYVSTYECICIVYRRDNMTITLPWGCERRIATASYIFILAALALWKIYNHCLENSNLYHSGKSHSVVSAQLCTNSLVYKYLYIEMQCQCESMGMESKSESELNFGQCAAMQSSWTKLNLQQVAQDSASASASGSPAQFVLFEHAKMRFEPVPPIPPAPLNFLGRKSLPSVVVVVVVLLPACHFSRVEN